MNKDSWVIDKFPPKVNHIDIIKNKKILNSLIKETLEDYIFEDFSFPREFTYCQGLGAPTFKITIDKNDGDFFIDEKGQKWIKAN